MKVFTFMKPSSFDQITIDKCVAQCFCILRSFAETTGLDQTDCDCVQQLFSIVTQSPVIAIFTFPYSAKTMPNNAKRSKFACIEMSHTILNAFGVCVS